MYCYHCASLIDTGNLLCPVCGNEPKEKNYIPPSQSEAYVPPKKKWIKIEIPLVVKRIALAWAIILVLTLVTLFVANKLSAESALVGEWTLSENTYFFDSDGSFKIDTYCGNYSVTSDYELVLEYTDLEHDDSDSCHVYKWSSAAKFSEGYWYIEDNYLYIDGIAYAK